MHLGPKIRANTVVAICFIGVGILTNPLLLGYLLKIDGFSLQNNIVLVIAEILLIVMGLLVYFTGNTPEGRNRLVFGVITAILIFVIVETGLHLITAVINTGEDQALHQLQPYRDTDWGEDFWKEAYETRIVSAPLIGWQTEEYHGNYVNIDADGVRKTWNPSFPPEQNYETVYVFGGSTLWGVGARDEHTIPSYLSKELNSSGDNFLVYNYGEPAYMSTQEVIRLALLLQEGHRPDYVIFYDGVNDIGGAYNSGTPGVQDYNILRQAMGYVESDSATRLITAGISKVIMNLMPESAVYQIIGNIAGAISPPVLSSSAVVQYDDSELNSLESGIITEYLSSMDLLDNLSDKYGFEYSLFWQPCIHTAKSVTSDDIRIADPLMEDPVLAGLYKSSTDYLVSNPPANFYDITDTFGADSQVTFIDWAHVSEAGNKEIAHRIYTLFTTQFNNHN